MTERDEKLREALRDHYAAKIDCELPCACLRNPQHNLPDCAGLADKVLAMFPFVNGETADGK